MKKIIQVLFLLMILIFHHIAGYNIIYKDVIEYHVGEDKVTMIVKNVQVPITQYLKDILSWEEIQ